MLSAGNAEPQVRKETIRAETTCLAGSPLQRQIYHPGRAHRRGARPPVLRSHLRHKLLTLDIDFGGRLDAEADAAAIAREHHDADPTVEEDGFTGASIEYEHRQTMF